jgi:hypothetical protein
MNVTSCFFDSPEKMFNLKLSSFNPLATKWVKISSGTRFFFAIVDKWIGAAIIYFLTGYLTDWLQLEVNEYSSDMYSVIQREFSNYVSK